MAKFWTMRVIDSHVHLYPPDANRDPSGWADLRGEPMWAAMCARRRKDGRGVQSFPSVDELLAEMDRASVERVILLGWYWHQHGTCSGQNRFYAKCVRAHPDRLSAFATVQPLCGIETTLAEMKQAAGEGLIGLGELSPHSQGYAIDTPDFGAVLAQATEMNWTVTFHVTDPNSRNYAGRVETPFSDFLQLARMYPRTRFILAHWGGLLPLRHPEALELDNLFYDTAASPLLYDDTVWRRFLTVVPAERVLFGSDFPLNVYPKTSANSEMSQLIAEAVMAGMPSTVMRRNAEKTFGF